MAKHRGRYSPNPSGAGVWGARAAAQLKAKDFRGAEAAAREALRLRPGDRAAGLCLGQALSGQGRTAEALEVYRTLHAARPQDRDVCLALAFACSKLGRFDEARAALEAGLRHHPADAYILYNLVILEPWTPDHPRFGAVREALARARSVQEQAALHFALAKMYENGGDHEQAFAAYRAANACARDIARRGPHFALRRYPAGIDPDQTLRQYDAAFFSARAGWPTPVEVPPVLVLGVSRSGKSLLANLLGAHPGLANLDERRGLGEAAMRWGDAMGAAPGTAGREAAAQFARAYAESLAAAAGAGRRGIDTQPLNIQLLGLLGVAVSNVQVIFVEREERDLVIANYCCHHQTPGFAYSCNLADCRAFIRNYGRLIGHWRQTAPFPIHSIRYEDLVADPDRVIRGALDFLGLGWDEACRPNRDDDVAFQGLTPGVSLTVRTRVEPGQVGCWRYYAEWLPAAFEADEADPG